jgi:outer membrane protein OmpA-like peptidoglycan-associated protein
MKRAGCILLLFFSLFGEYSIYAQDIQWASSVEFQYNQYGENDWSAKQVLGPPNATPFGNPSPKAFRLSAESAFGTVIVKFQYPQPVQQLIIVESFLPGRISEVILYDINGGKYSVFKGNPASQKEKYKALIINVPKTNYDVAKVEVNVNTFAAPGWSQIDAIGLANFSEPARLESALQTYGLAEVHQQLSFAGERENLGKNINTEYTETKPIISPDGKTLYFCRQNYPGNIKGKKDEQDIYISSITNGNFSVASNIGPPLNDGKPNGVSSVTPDGNTLLLINTYGKGKGNGEGASISHRTKSGWSDPTPIFIKDYYNRSPYVDYFLANNGKVLLMALERNDSYGDQDLYVSFYAGDNKWTQPKNLGSVINTPKAEFSAFLASDMKTLYFSSDGHGGYGGSDIFYSKRLDESWTNWSTPKNLGAAVNTPDWDAYYTISAKGDFAFFVSKKGGIKGSKDIFRIGLPQEFKPEPVLLVAGKVYNAKTNEPIAAKIIVETLQDGVEQGIARSNPDNGDYKIVLQRGQKYGFLAQAKGYIAVTENIDLSQIDEYTEITKDLYLYPIEVGQIVRMNNIFFDRGTANLLPESNAELERLVAFMKENPKVRIELGGHTDNQGFAKVNLALSDDRVHIVKKFLMDRGIEGKRLETKAYGGLKPIASNLSEETRQLNRRVEITILSNQ